MNLVQITLVPRSVRLLEDIVEAYDNDPDGLADIVGYSFERLDEAICGINSALNAGKKIPARVTVTKTPIMINGD